MAEAGEKLKVFVSYSRADLAFADELAAGLEIMGFAPLIDRHAIREGEDWQTRLGNLITEAGTVVFVLSPDSARSPVCEWEVEHAQALSKRIMPALWRGLHERPLGKRSDGMPWPEGPAPAPKRIAALNYVRFDAHEDGRSRSFMEGLKALTRALNTDLDWLNEHTRLLSRALEWDRGGRAANRLMSGADIASAKAWAARRPANAPELTELHRDFIKASEDAEAAKFEEEKKRIAEREAAARKAEQAAKAAEEAARAAEAAQKERAVAVERAEQEQQGRIAALAQAETAAKETARTQRRVGRLLWGIGALVVFMLAGTIWASRETEQRETLVMLSKTADAMNEGRYDRAMRYAIHGLPAKGAVPYLSPWDSALERQLAEAAVLSRLRLTLRGHQKGLREASFSSDGKRVVTVSDDGRWEWDANTGELILKTASEQPIASGPFTRAVTPNGNWIITASRDGELELSDPATGKLNTILKGHSNTINAAVFTKQGFYLLTASDDGTARLWSATGHDEIGFINQEASTVFKGHQRAVNTAKFSLDEKLVVTASEDKTARVWSYYGELLNQLVHESAVNSAAFNPDATLVVTASSDGSVRVWIAHPSQPIAELEQLESLHGKKALEDSRSGNETKDGNARIRVTDPIWLGRSGPTLRDRVCAEKLIGAQDFTDEELADPILSGIAETAKYDATARNPCLRRGPLHWEYYTQTAQRWWRWATSLLTAPKPATAQP